MYLIGLTGGIGAGKTTVTDLFAALGAAIIDTDQIAHALSGPGQPGALAVGARFGPQYLDAQGAINRPALRQLIFSTPAAKQQLEASLHPLIHQAVLAALAALPANIPYAVLAVPLLFETGSYLPLIQRSLLVDAPEDAQIQRVQARSRLGEAEIRAIMAQQMSRQDRQQRADDIVLNDGDLSKLQDQVKNLHKKYTQASESQQESA